MTTMNELLKKSERDLDCVSVGLRSALHNAGEVAALILFPLIKRVTEARAEVAALASAHSADLWRDIEKEITA